MKRILMLLLITFLRTMVFGQAIAEHDQWFFTDAQSQNYFKGQRKIISTNQIQQAITTYIQIIDGKEKIDTIYRNVAQYDLNGNLVSHKPYHGDQLSNDHYYEYDSKNRIVKDSSKETTNKWSYDMVGNNVKEVYYWSNMIESSITYTLNTFDKRGNIIHSISKRVDYAEEKKVPKDTLFLEEKFSIYDTQNRLMRSRTIFNTKTGTAEEHEQWRYIRKKDSIYVTCKTSLASEHGDSFLRSAFFVYDKFGNAVKRFITINNQNVAVSEHVYNFKNQLVSFTTRTLLQNRLVALRSDYVYNADGTVKGEYGYTDGKLMSKVYYRYRKFKDK